MAAITPDLGHGTTITIGGVAGMFANLTGIDWSGISRNSVDTTTFSTSGGKTFIPSDTYDPGELQVTLQFDTDVVPPIVDTEAECVITFPDAETWTAQIFMTGYEFSAQDEEVMEATATFKVTGSIAW